MYFQIESKTDERENIHLDIETIWTFILRVWIYIIKKYFFVIYL
jgi:hypothetical protein